jgi:hypothetical protein
MGKGNHDLVVWVGLVILFFVMLVFIFFTQYQTGFFQNFAPLF